MSEHDAPHEAAEEGAGAESSALEQRSALGSRAHVRRTLDRVSVALADSRARAARSEALRERADTLLTRSDELVQASHALRAQLRASVTAYVRRLYTDGVPPQRMLVLVKSAVRDAAPGELDASAARELMDHVVRWSIDAYYAA